MKTVLLLDRQVNDIPSGLFVSSDKVFTRVVPQAGYVAEHREVY